MVIAHHIIFGAYGFWLPNDPRGSWSQMVAAWELRRFGPATTTDVPCSVAAAAHDRNARLEAKKSLHYPPVEFTGTQARAIARGFAEFVNKSGLVVRACSIMPDHVHLVVDRHRYGAEQIANLLKGAATRRLKEEDLHPLARWPRPDGRLPKCWERGEWKVYLEDEEDVVRRDPLRRTEPD